MTNDDAAKVREKAKDFEMEYGLGLYAGDDLKRAYRATGVPWAVLLDREGAVVWYGHPMGLAQERIAALLD